MATPKNNNGSRFKKNVSSARALSNAFVDTTLQQKMVSEAAYYRAMSRNFEGGDPVVDWLEAEREIATKLSPE